MVFLLSELSLQKDRKKVKADTDISIIMKYNKKDRLLRRKQYTGKGKYLVAGITAADLFGMKFLL